MKTTFKKIVSLALTVLMVAGMFTMLVPMTASAEEAEPIYLKKNETDTINGITYRFDVHEDDDTTWARINPDGTWEVSLKYGDMLWFPDIKMTDDSRFHTEMTNTTGNPTDGIFIGPAYAVRSNSNSTYDTANVAVLKTDTRVRGTAATRENLRKVSGSDHGQGGTDRAFDIGDWNGKYGNAAWKAMTNANYVWDNGKTFSVDVYQTSDKVVIEFGNPEYGLIWENLDQTSYARSNSKMYAISGGSVGYTIVNQNAKNKRTHIRIEELVVTNCTVGGVAKDTYRIGPGTLVEPHTNFEVKGNVYRFDPLPENKYSQVVVMPDETMRVRLNAGDLLWMPETKDIEGAFSSVKMIKNNGGYNKDQISAGIAYDIEFGENGVWGDDSDSLNYATTHTSWRRRIRTTTLELRNVGGDNLGVQTNNTLEAERRNEAYLAWGSTWSVGKTLNTSLYTNENGYFYASFMNENNVEMTYDYYSYGDEESRKVMDGPVGFYALWAGDSTDRGYMTVDILELYAVVEEPEITDAKVSLSLDGTIGLNFAFNAKNFENATVVGTKNGVEVVNQAVVDGENVVTVPVAAKEMTDEVNFAVLVDGEVFEEHSYTTSVAAYANQIMADDNYNEWDELIGSMLNYGAAAQKLFDYKADALAPGASAEVDFDFSDYTAVQFSGEKSILKGLFVNLSLESETTLKVYFMPAEGVELDVTVNGKDAELKDNGDGYYVLSIAGIAADKLDDDFAIVVNDQLSFGVNALDWARLATNNADANVANAARALAAYGVAAGKKF